MYGSTVKVKLYGDYVCINGHVFTTLGIWVFGVQLSVVVQSNSDCFQAGGACAGVGVVTSGGAAVAMVTNGAGALAAETAAEE